MSIFLTVASLFAPAAFAQTPDREMLVQIAYRQLPELVDFAVRSRPFLEGLTEGERGHLAQIYEITELLKTQNEYRRFENPNEMMRRVLEQPSPKLEFSNEGKNFQLNPGEPERSAMTTERMADPIIINNHILNASQGPSLKNTLQLLFHEVGHKLGKHKDQATVDRLAAKLMAMVAPYLIEARLGEGLTAELLSLPKEFRRMTFNGGTPRTYLVLQEKGQVLYHDLELGRVAASMQRFVSIPEGSGNIMESTSIRITGLRGGAKGYRSSLELEIEGKSQMVFLSPDLDLRPGAGGRMHAREQVHALLAPSLTNVTASVQVNRPREGAIPQYYEPQVGAWHFSEGSQTHRVRQFLATDVQGSKFSAQVESANQIQTLDLRLETTEGEVLVRGERLAAQSFVFEIPKTLTSHEGSAHASELIVNGQVKTALPEVVNLKLPVSKPTTTREAVLEILHEGQWHSYQELQDRRITKLNDSPLRFRLRAGADANLLQVRLRWNKGSALTWKQPENIFGTYGTVSEELVSLKLTSQTPTEKIYEFQSHQVFEKALLPTANEIIGQVDEGKRVLKEVLTTTSSMETTHSVDSPSLKVFTQEFLQVKPRSHQSRDLVPAKATAKMCKSIF